ncbi:4-alpha-glucanotransferase, partial [Candidatus Aerophobetes bacterium]|nr:4-alpha-glucanotransferase [Candidatus Aerophobetes bacterium]
MKRRTNGVLVHITSLPSPYGVGDVGPEAYKFVDFLAEAKQNFWQLLPLTPTHPVYGNSPYTSSSAFAANSLLISPDMLINQGFLEKKDVRPVPSFPQGWCDYQEATSFNAGILNCAYERFCAKKEKDYEYERFCKENSAWLEDYVLFVALKERFEKRAWVTWPPEVRDRKRHALAALKEELRERIKQEKFFQYLFFSQWRALKRYCNEKGIQIIGDVPIYVNYDSADVWANPEIFKLDEEKKPSVVSGVPPDYFSKTGQLWGNPIYRWEALEHTGYRWWVQRVKHNLTLFDVVRVDHFRGFMACWEVPAGERTAVKGKWVEAPGEDFFHTLGRHLPYLPIIAEDLGVITPDVREVMQKFDFPGMRVLLFAFGEDNPAHPYLPHNYVKNCVVYTGTHDNNTARGWFEKEAAMEEK